jgi:hypothetical protein
MPDYQHKDKKKKSKKAKTDTPADPTPVEEVKPWYKSKTMIFNVLAVVAAVAAEFGYAGTVPEDASEWVVGAVAIINIILRMATKQPVGTGK